MCSNNRLLHTRKAWAKILLVRETKTAFSNGRGPAPVQERWGYLIFFRRLNFDNVLKVGFLKKFQELDLTSNLMHLHVSGRSVLSFWFFFSLLKEYLVFFLWNCNTSLLSPFQDDSQARRRNFLPHSDPMELLKRLSAGKLRTLIWLNLPNEKISQNGSWKLF